MSDSQHGQIVDAIFDLIDETPGYVQEFMDGLNITGARPWPDSLIRYRPDQSPNRESESVSKDVSVRIAHASDSLVPGGNPRMMMARPSRFLIVGRIGKSLKLMSLDKLWLFGNAVLKAIWLANAKPQSIIKVLSAELDTTQRDGDESEDYYEFRLALAIPWEQHVNSVP